VNHYEPSLQASAGKIIITVFAIILLIAGTCLATVSSFFLIQNHRYLSWPQAEAQVTGITRINTTKPDEHGHLLPYPGVIPTMHFSADGSERTYIGVKSRVVVGF
jgi:hypothetical protein